MPPVPFLEVPSLWINPPLIPSLPVSSARSKMGDVDLAKTLGHLTEAATAAGKSSDAARIISKEIKQCTASVVNKVAGAGCKLVGGGSSGSTKSKPRTNFKTSSSSRTR